MNSSFNNKMNFRVETPKADKLSSYNHKNKQTLLEDSHIIYASVQIDGREVLKESNLKLTLTQPLLEHHNFELICGADAFSEEQEYLLINTRNHLGKRITIQFKQFSKTASLFTGIITKISNKKIDGVRHIIITGSSPSILMENTQNNRSFTNKTLEDILKEVSAPYPDGLIKFNINPNYKDKLPYTVQTESDWQFIQKLAVRYGEYTYYNGSDVIFSPWGSKIIELTEQEEVFDYELEMQVSPQQFNYTTYNPHTKENYTIDSRQITVEASQNPFQQFALNAGKSIFNTSPSSHYNTTLLTQGEKEVKQAVTIEKQKRQNLVYLKAKSCNPSLRVGDIVKFNIWMPGHTTFKNGKVPAESYRITQITHHFEDGEGYYNLFTGVPKDLTVPPYTDQNNYPRADIQHAVVTDNKDPQKMGRVKVQFVWQHPNNETTPWIQVAQLHGGEGKGSYYNPEIGESVVVGFMGGSAEKPFVIGTAYNGGEIAEYYTEGNDLKVLRTRSGTKIVMNDAEGSILIEDPSGNTYLMDGKGNIKTNAPKNIEMTAGEDFILNVGRNMTTSVGQNKTTTVGQNASTNVGMQYNLFAGDIMETAVGDIKTRSEQITRQAAKDIESISTEGNILQNAEKQVNNNSGEKSINF